MSYIEKNLLQNEKIEYKWKIHIYYKYITFIIATIWIILFITTDSIEISEWFNIINPLTTIGFMLFIIFTYFFLNIINKEIAVTDKRVLYKTWILARNVFELQIDKIESVKLHQSIIQRIIWAWDIIVSWAGLNEKSIPLLKTPNEMKNIIYKQLEK